MSKMVCQNNTKKQNKVIHIYWFDITLKKSGETKMLSFNKVFISLSLCFVYLMLFYKPF